MLSIFGCEKVNNILRYNKKKKKKKNGYCIKLYKRLMDSSSKKPFPIARFIHHCDDDDGDKWNDLAAKFAIAVNLCERQSATARISNN